MASIYNFSRTGVLGDKGDALSETGSKASVMPSARWIESQKLAFGVSLLSTIESPSNSQLAEVFDPIVADLPFDIPKLHTSGAARLESLPPVVLESLCRIPKSKLGYYADFIPVLESVRERCKWDARNNISPNAGAKLVAELLQFGQLEPAQILRIAKLELKCDWDKANTFGEVDSALGSLVDVISQPFQATNSRVTAVNTFHEKFGSLRRWHMVENALLQHCYSWPLLDFYGRGLTLPISVDIVLGSEGPANLITDGAIGIRTTKDSQFDGNEWSVAAQIGLDAARGLWLKTHGSYPEAYRDAVSRASVTIDLRLAEVIAAPYQSWLTNLENQDGVRLGPFLFAGGSLGVYLGLVIYGHLIGNDAIETICATGELRREGEKRDWLYGSDWRVEKVATQGKITLAEQAFYFDKGIVPRSQHSKNESSDADDILGGRSRMQICEGAKFSDFAAHAFGQDSRRHRYIRCPDVAFAFKPDNGCAVNDESVETILRRLRANNDPVLILNHDVLDLSRALYFVQAHVESCVPPQEINQNLASFAYVRTMKNEINERFWEVVWDAIGGSTAAFEYFRFVTSAESAARTLAGELNRLEPQLGEGRRAPDILVVVGSSNVYQSRYSIVNGPFSRLSIEPLLPELRKQLRASPIAAVREGIGNTRMILMPNTTFPNDFVGAVTVVDEFEIDSTIRDTIRKLSCFKFGFTHQMACRLLDVGDAKCNELTRMLRRSSYKSKRFLKYIERTGEFFLQVRVADNREQNTRSMLALSAANAIVGFLAKTPTAARFDFREALAPARMHEAQDYLNEAARGSPSVRNQAIQRRERLSRVAEPLGWTRVRWAATESKEDGKEVFEATARHLRKWEERKFLIHPLEFVWTAKLALKLARQVAKQEGEAQQEFSLNMFRQAEHLFRQAARACRSFDHDDEGDRCRFVVATSRACMWMSRYPNNTGIVMTEDDVTFALEFNGVDNDNMEAGWFDYLGDREVDHSIAALAYRRGIRVDEEYGIGKVRDQLLIKYFGAHWLAGTEPDNDIRTRLPVSDKCIGRIRPKVEHETDSGLHEIPYARDRWRAGRNFLVVNYDKYNQS